MPITYYKRHLMEIDLDVDLYARGRTAPAARHWLYAGTRALLERHRRGVFLAFHEEIDSARLPLPGRPPGHASG